MGEAILGDAVDLLPIMEGYASDEQMKDAKQLVSGAQELLANAFVAKVMPQLQSV